MTDVVTRFAPSPTGHLHLGHAHSALFGWTTARKAGGRFLLRIEDIDPQRCRPEFDRDLREDLAWLGLTWEEPVRRQSEHAEDYRTALARLDGLGAVYPCFCTRKDIAAEIARAGQAPHGPDGPLYPGTCRALSDLERQDRIAAGAAYALRLDVEKAVSLTGPLRWHDRRRGWQDATPEILGDVVLARKDAPTSYHLAVTLDDHLQGVTLVTRGNDLFFATHVHRLLQELLRFGPPDYEHHPLLVNERGERLAKRDNAKTLRSLRESGQEPSAVRALAGFPEEL
ncbi:glutamyl-Q tRNA(Asp) synthetase [Azospirillum sp. OGB3]|uniref:tRNA glutamyl-Q(34) synthetase GluQRS n=1 Tax=Azospirillum sp. OGB3 TaxID=2587012 RepID=UPI0016057BB8|nr:tRNA glutamyl-Q(34) synthetase GluQRS [Azospirillum sp. OGB3]MBB3263369.1 glutamyl-Q tRNA(Asp) synthetase [Azospirillum sp. OGB3]